MNGFRTGLMDSALHPRFASDLLLRTTRQTAAAGGADSMWIPDHLNGILPRSIWTPKHLGMAKLLPKADATLEPWTTLGYVAAQNRLTRLRLGVGVTDAGRRNPAVTAQAAATIHQLSRGRAILGIGPGEREGNQPYGVNWEKPVARFGEALATIRALWNSGGSPVTRESQFFPLDKAVFDIPPHKGKWPEIWVAAHGPRMLRIAGRYADAWFPAYPQQPKQYAEKLAAVQAAAVDAGRDPTTIIPAATLFVLTARSSGQVDEMVESVGARAYALCVSAEVWARHGVEHPLGANFSGIQDLLPQNFDAETALDYVKRVPPSLIREVCLTGTPSEILDQASEWRDHGLRYAVLCNISAVHTKLSVGLASSLPLIQILRGMRRL
ncbi:LLM class flavin-dependent oxidoreductase [Rhodococcoides kyotonense]|uniref:Phthiodiolone/phenolphthiodiolone dimycocerosates ketoreductase n=1 Tax=Rhodococcoides kyotonense TaxID=398843 RepID=A0A239J8D6_9NOCA|nr:LLM class flavin-dependent oxidoreductase [Rhodococcus kyotonensis]SNT00924.1 phthiodiolone/phenolphthiodiolone dimycocerosates ketoreductase [Rhodococcus kyotonensis]